MPGRPAPVVIVASLLLVALTGCGALGDRTADAPPSSSAAAGTSATVTAPASSGPASSGPAPSTGSAPTRTGPITLAFGGDVHFSAQLEDLVDRPDALAELRPTLGAADLAMVNLETAITDRGEPEPKQFHFRTSPQALDRLAEAGVDVVTMANNHAVDYGPDGLADTLDAKQGSPIPIVGVGADSDEAYAPAYLEVRGSTVAVLGATQVPDWTLAHWSASAGRGGVAAASSPTRIAAAVRRARARADVVVVYLHWGTDYTECPNALQRRTADALAEAGADVVLGAHAHRLQGGGWMGRTYVAYGLGNFVWWRRNNEVESRTGVLTLSLSGRRVTDARWTPMRVSADGIPRVPDDAAARDRLLDRWNATRRCAGLAAGPPA